MKNKGFTLTELLVVVVILGIISGMAVPLIRGLSSVFERKKYSSYKDSMIVAAKLYNDSYSEDLFGHNENGCAYITFDQLVDRNLLKDIDIQGVSCNSDKTYVRVTKQKDKYMYVGYLACGEKTDGKIQDIDVSLPSFIPDMDTNACTGVNPSTIVIGATKEKSEEYNKKKKSTKLTLTSYTGIDTKNSVYIKWSQNENAYNSDDGWEKVTFKIAGNQQEKINNGDLPIVSTSKELITPSGDSSDGSWILFVRVDQLKDIYGNKWINPDKEKLDSKYVSFQPFNVDTIAPVISNLAVTSTASNYNSENVKVTFTGTDNHSKDEDLKMCITTGSNGCKNASDYEPYTSSKNKTLDTSGSANKTVYVYLKDKAGNVSSSTKQYTIQGFVHVYYKACDANGDNCSQFKEDTLTGNYGESVTITPVAKEHYTAPGAVTRNYGGNHTLTFTYTYEQNYDFFGHGTNNSNYTVSSNSDSAMTIVCNKANGNYIVIYPVQADSSYTKKWTYETEHNFSYNLFSSSEFGAGSNGKYGIYFASGLREWGNTESNVGADTLAIRPYIQLIHKVDGKEYGSRQYKTIRSTNVQTYAPTKTGYTLRAWRAYGETKNSNGMANASYTACVQNNKPVYYDKNFTFNATDWNISNSSYPCPTMWGYVDGVETVYLEAIWQKTPVADYK